MDSPQDELVMKYLPLVKRIAGALFGVRFFDGVPFEEYLQFGAEGLMQAIQRYDPSVGARFETYAQYRIKGAIITGLEKSTEINQQVATLRRMAQERIDSLVEEDPGEGGVEGAAAPDAFQRLIQVSLGLAVAFMLEDSSMFQKGESTRWDDGASNLAYKQMQRKLTSAMDALSDKERAVVQSHYFEHLSFEETARSLKLTKGRISQLHRSALRKLRDSLAVQHQMGEFIA
jgi:RNA polymerase sigma factor for flagellar operon FliA